MLSTPSPNVKPKMSAWRLSSANSLGNNDDSRKSGIAFIELEGDLDKLSYTMRAKYGIKPIFVEFGADNARTTIDNMASDDWASFCEVNPWQSKMAL